MERWIDELKRGRDIPGDCGTLITEKPKWFDKAKYTNSIKIFHDYTTGILLSHMLGTILMSQVKSLVETLLYSGNHATIQSSVKRATLTVKYVNMWYEGDIFDPEDKAHINIKLVRGMHAQISKRLNSTDKKETDGVWVSQYDMALTQFAFIGALAHNPKSLGVNCSHKTIEAFMYFWRCVGYLLGIDEVHNICGRGLSELRVLCQDIIDEVVLPTWSNPCEDYTRTIIYGFHGFAKLGTSINYTTMFNLTCDVIIKPQLKKKLDFSATFSYWFYRFIISMMKYDRFRKRSNERHLRVSARKVEKVLLEIESKKTENNISPIQMGITEWIFSWIKVVWSMLWKSYNNSNQA